MNHEPAPSLGQDPVHKLAGEAAQPVTVRYYHLLDLAGVHTVEQSNERGAMPVEAGGDVAQELVLGEGGAEVTLLPL